MWIIVWYDDRVNRKLNFFKNFTTIAYEVIQLILLYVVGTDVLSRRLLILEEAGMPEKKSLVSHTSTVDHEDRIRVAAVRRKCIVHWINNSRNGLC